MISSRRSFLTGLIAAPAAILTPGLLMPVKRVPPPASFVALDAGFGPMVWASTYGPVKPPRIFGSWAEVEAFYGEPLPIGRA